MLKHEVITSIALFYFFLHWYVQSYFLTKMAKYVRITILQTIIELNVLKQNERVPASEAWKTGRDPHIFFRRPGPLRLSLIFVGILMPHHLIYNIMVQATVYKSCIPHSKNQKSGTRDIFGYQMLKIVSFLDRYIACQHKNIKQYIGNVSRNICEGPGQWSSKLGGTLTFLQDSENFKSNCVFNSNILSYIF